jgi:adenylosuccinate lyase
VGEVQEEFGKGQKGSSAMPHKKNPWRFENVTGLARIVRNNAGAALENQALWHERDISNSSVERVIFPDSTIALDFMLDRMSNLIETLVVNPERMAENMDTSRGLVFSGTLLLEITRKGVTREEAYGLVQSHAMETWEQGGSFQERILADERILSILEREEILKVFDLSHALRNVDAIFARVRKKRK